jgi:hypothetical protein
MSSPKGSPADRAAFRFRRQDTIGSADAEEDAFFLRECFIETGDLKVLRDCHDPRRIVVGRTGSGKTALLIRLAENQTRTIEIKPESLALSYISNSTILRFISDLGVKLDIFFKLLWRHVLTVEIIRKHFHATEKRSLAQIVRSLFTEEKHKKAIDYLEKWGKSFWEEFEYRIKEVTTNLETELKGAIQGKMTGFSMDSSAGRKMSEEQKGEIVQRAQEVVNHVQIRELSEVLELLNDVLRDPQKPYFITIDRLDEEWIEDRLRYRLIRALIETARDFRKVENAKVVIALRADLIDRVFRLTRDAGFQEEKYSSLFINLQWSEQRLLELVDKRVAFMVKQRYTSKPLSYRDLLPKSISKVKIAEYMLSRTLMRPRDIIDFVNTCINHAVDKTSLTVDLVRKAEGEYSRTRLKALADEWFADFPNLLEASAILKRRSPHFSLTDITEGECEDFCLDLMVSDIQSPDAISMAASRVVDCAISPTSFRKVIAQIFHLVGLIGLRLGPSETTQWITTGRTTISEAEITDTASLYVHKAFWRVLGIRE